MSRASVASATAYAGAWRNFAFGSSLLHAFRALSLDKFARWAIPASVLIFVSLVAGFSYKAVRDEEERIISSATKELDLLVSVLAADVEEHMRAAQANSPLNAFSRAAIGRPLMPGQTIILSDPDGNIIARYPESSPLRTSIDRLDIPRTVAAFADTSGSIRLALVDGEDVFATARKLRTSTGMITVMRSLSDVLADRRATLDHATMLVSSLAAVLGLLALAFFWQASKASRADCSRRRMRDRVDMALARGRCGLWDWDLLTGQVLWSTSMYQLVGLAPRATMGFAEINDMIHPQDGGLNAIIRTLSVSGTTSIDHVFRMLNTAGDWVWLRAKVELVHEDGGSPHLTGIAIDITETMALEERSTQADMRLRDAIETISEAFVVWDADNRLVMCNSKFQRFHNLPSEAVAPGTPYAAVMERGTAPLVQQVAMDKEQPLGARTFEAQLGDGRWLQINERRTKDGGYVSVGTDITTLKRNEAQLLDSESRLLASNVDLRKARQSSERQAQELAELAQKYWDQKAEAEKASLAKSDFLANMSHELRTPLNAILGFSEIMMLESYGPHGSPLYSEYARDIHTSGQYLFGVIADVLEMSRLEAGRVRLEKTIFQIGEAIENATATVASSAAETGIELSSAPAGMRLSADRTAVEKILAILLRNAIKYTPSGGKISVSTRMSQGNVNLYVEDTGVGISPEAIARLGKPFEQSDLTLKNGMRGSGLGLAIARSLVELHGGTMRISSQQDKGTVVLVQLPGLPSASRPKLQLAASSGVATTQLPRFALQRLDRTARKISRTA